MTRMRTVRRSTPVRRTPVPQGSSVAAGFMGLLAKLNLASDRLDKSRPRRR